MKDLNERLENIEALIVLHSLKKVLTLDELTEYTGLSKSHIYKLTSTGGIPCYKPHGKHIYFNREEIDNWLLQRRNTTKAELEEEAANYVTLNKENHV